MLDMTLFRAAALVRTAALTIDTRGPAARCSVTDMVGLCGTDGPVCLACALRDARDDYAGKCRSVPGAELAEALTTAIEAALRNGVTASPDTASTLRLLAHSLETASVTPED